jgi:hypothetical protein
VRRDQSATLGRRWFLTLSVLSARRAADGRRWGAARKRVSSHSPRRSACCAARRKLTREASHARKARNNRAVSLRASGHRRRDLSHRLGEPVAAGVHSGKGRALRALAKPAARSEIDVLQCARCGGRMRVISVVEEPAVIEKLLRHLGLPHVPLPTAPARSGNGRSLRSLPMPAVRSKARRPSPSRPRSLR